MDMASTGTVGAGSQAGRWWPPAEGPWDTWWASQAAQASRVMLCGYLFPLLATWEHLRLAWAEESALRTMMAAYQRGYWDGLGALFRVEAASAGREHARDEPSNVAGLTRGDLEEVARALQEFEEDRGDWSKAR
jgi:hypothetical protein